jgi:hypothetical protein
MASRPGVSLRTYLERIIVNAGRTLWPRLPQNPLLCTRTMNELLPDKVFRLGHSLATRPKDVSRWLTSWHVLPIRSGLPWLAWGAVDFLERFLNRSHSVFEYGTG